MKASKKANLERKSKLTTESIAQKAFDVAQTNSGLKPRRSIPVAEVNQMIEHAERQIKASRTIYDDRLEVLGSLEQNEAHIEDLENRLHHARLNNKRICSNLAQINLAITRQLELDGQ